MAQQQATAVDDRQQMEILAKMQSDGFHLMSQNHKRMQNALKQNASQLYNSTEAPLRNYKHDMHHPFTEEQDKTVRVIGRGLDNKHAIGGADSQTPRDRVLMHVGSMSNQGKRNSALRYAAGEHSADSTGVASSKKIIQIGKMLQNGYALSQTDIQRNAAIAYSSLPQSRGAQGGHHRHLIKQANTFVRDHSKDSFYNGLGKTHGEKFMPFGQESIPSENVARVASLVDQRQGAFRNQQMKRDSLVFSQQQMTAQREGGWPMSNRKTRYGAEMSQNSYKIKNNIIGAPSEHKNRAFEANKFQSYTNLPSAMSNQPRKGKSVMKNKASRNEDVYNVIDKLQQPVPLSVNQRELHLRKVHQSMSKTRRSEKFRLDNSFRQNVQDQTIKEYHSRKRDEETETIHASLLPAEAPMLIDNSASPSLDNATPSGSRYPLVGVASVKSRRDEGPQTHDEMLIGSYPSPSKHALPRLALQSGNSLSYANFKQSYQNNPLAPSGRTQHSLALQNGMPTDSRIHVKISHQGAMTSFYGQPSESHSKSKSSLRRATFKTPKEHQMGILQRAMYQRVTKASHADGSAPHVRELAREAKVGQAILKTGGLADDAIQTSGEKSAENRKEIASPASFNKQAPTSRETVAETPDSDDFVRSHHKAVTLGDPDARAKYEAWKRKEAGKDSDSSSSSQSPEAVKKDALSGGTSLVKTETEFQSKLLSPAVTSPTHASKKDKNMSNVMPSPKVAFANASLFTDRISGQNMISTERVNDESHPAAGLDPQKYLITKSFGKMQSFLKKLGAERQSKDTVSGAIDEAARQCKIDLSADSIDKLKHDLGRLVSRRIDEKRENELARSKSPTKRGPNGEILPAPCCQVARRSKQFIDFTKGKVTIFPEINQSPSVKNTPAKSAAIKRGRKNQKQIVEERVLSPDVKCTHGSTEQEIFEDCVKLYEKFIKFKEHLYLTLEGEIHHDVLAKGIIDQIKADASVDLAALKAFSNQKDLRKLLSDPIIQIIDSHEEHQQELEAFDRPSPTVTRKLCAVVSELPRKSATTSPTASPARLAKIIRTKKQQAVTSAVLQELDTLEQQSKILGLGATWRTQKNEAPKQGNQTETRAAATNFYQLSLQKIKQYQSIQELVAENLRRDRTMLEAGELTREQRKNLERKIFDTIMNNTQTFFRLDLIKNFIQQQEVERSLAPSWQGYQQLDLDEENEEQNYNLRYLISGIDDHVSQGAKDLIDKSNKFWTAVKPLQKLIRLRVEPKQKADTFETNPDLPTHEDDSKDSASVQSEPEEDHRQNLLFDLEAKQKFYQKAKHEIAGNNLPPTQESKFYRRCKEQGVLPFPIFKCLNDNAFFFHGKKMTSGYVKAISEMIEDNDDPLCHILTVWLDDCAMSDADFATIIKAIMATRKYWTSLQSIHYSNNEFGSLSAEALRALITMEHITDDATFPKQVYALKTLALTNVSFRQAKSLRDFASMLGDTPMIHLQSLQLKQINLNETEVLFSLCRFIEQAESLEHLTLSQCNLGAKSLTRDDEAAGGVGKNQFNSGLLKIFEAISRNVEPLRKLDLSGNPIGSTIPKHQETLTLIIDLICDIINYGHLDALDLSGMQLTTMLAQRLLPQIRTNNKLSYLNISKNCLSAADHDWFLKSLNVIDPAAQEACFSGTGGQAILNANQLLLLNDQCFMHAFNDFKVRHLKSNYMESRTKTPEHMGQAQGTVAATDEPELGSIQQTMINTAVMKRVQESRLLSKKINLEAEVGGLRQQAAQNSDGVSYVDNIILRRQPNRPELVFNQLQTSGLQRHPAPFDTYDFTKPTRWEFVEIPKEGMTGMGGQQGGKMQLAQELDLNRLEGQYVSLCINSSNIEKSGFREVSDKRLLHLLFYNYGFDIAKESLANQALSPFIAFGSLTGWKAYKMAKLFHLTSAMIVSTHEKEREQLITHVCDQINFKLHKNFKKIHETVWPLWQALLKDENALQLGFTDKDLDRMTVSERSHFVEDEAYAFCQVVDQVGPQSLFVYDARTHKLYFQSVMVEYELQSRDYITRRTRGSAAKPIVGTDPESPLPKLTEEEVDLPIVPVGVDGKEIGQLFDQALLIDVAAGTLDIVGLFDTRDDLQNCIEAIQMNYAQLTELFQETVANCQLSSNLISLESFVDFMRMGGLAPQEMLVLERRKLTDLERALIMNGCDVNEGTKRAYDLQQLGDTMTRSQFIRALVWLFKLGHKHNYYPHDFNKYLQKFIVPLGENSTYWVTKQNFRQNEAIQKMINDYAPKMLQFFEVAAHTRGCYTGFTQIIAQEIFLDGELNIHKPEAPKPVAKKKGKKKKAEPAPTAPKRAGPPPEPTPISKFNLAKFFLLSQKMQLNATSISRTSHQNGELTTIDELGEFIYRIATYIYDASSYESHVEGEQKQKLPKEIASMLEEEDVVKFEKVLRLALKAAKISYDDIPLLAKA